MIGMTVLHIAITVRNLTASGEPVLMALSSSTSVASKTIRNIQYESKSTIKAILRFDYKKIQWTQHRMKVKPFTASPFSLPKYVPAMQHLLKIILFSVSVPVLSVSMYSTCPKSSLIAVLAYTRKSTAIYWIRWGRHV